MTHPSIPFRKNWGKRTEPRIGVMLHYDASARDQSAILWFTREGCNVSYNWLVMDSGNIIPIAPHDARAWHAGCCKSDDPRLVYRDGNSAFYGLSIAATEGELATREAKRSVATMCLHVFMVEGWPVADVWRIVSHRAHAVYCPGHARAGQHGRKSDPEGPDRAHPVMSTNEIRGLVAARNIT